MAPTKLVWTQLLLRAQDPPGSLPHEASFGQTADVEDETGNPKTIKTPWSPWNEQVPLISRNQNLGSQW